MTHIFNPQGDHFSIAYNVDYVINQLITASLNGYGKNNENTQEKNRFIQSESAEWHLKRQQSLPVEWPTIGDFTNSTIGCEKIVEYIEKEWKSLPGGPDPIWGYAVDFFERKSFETHDLYIYQVRYSAPTRRRPIPRQSVSIFFTINVSKTESQDGPVKVSFMFETTRMIHFPDKFRFRQSWLQIISQMKENLARELDF